MKFPRLLPAILLAFSVSTGTSALRGAEPLLEKIDLFEAGQGGYALYRIPGMVVTEAGTVLAYCEARRTGKSDWDTIDLMLRRSTDGGKTWSERQKIAAVPGPKTKNPVALAQKLGNPDDVTYIARLSTRPASDKNRILFANPHNLERADGKEVEGRSRDRKNLSIKLTYDEGKTWPVNKSLEPGYSAYSDLAVLPDGTALCFYERGRNGDAEPKRPTSYAYLTLARFNLEWLTDGRDSMASGK